MSHEIILHHYDTSPFSEKPRLLFGLRGVTWRSVIQPTIMPKPDLVPLTGGYRRAPVMQIGADIFCDSQVILAEIERRAGTAVDGVAWAVNLWADRVFFQSSVAVIFGEIGASVPRAFIEDREKLMGRPFDVAAMKAAGAPMRGQWRAQAGWIDAALAGGRPFLAGEAAGIADFAAYMNVWFMVSFAPHIGETLLVDLPALAAWRERVKAIGHGVRSEMTTAEALEIARAAEPGSEISHDPADPSGLAPGAAVTVGADDYGRDPIPGRLVAANRERVVIERRDDSLGRLHVHFPRAGYILAAAA
ncbi:MAG TPA: glutathione S-transferase family protein [Caulobacteraceae bacterium]|nr:glutathione S-transferase family protein [Caulobacteraceae bacterium]